MYRREDEQFCESIEEMAESHWDWADLKINKLKILLEENRHESVMENFTTSPMYV